MIEFAGNIWNWIVTNGKEILVVLSSVDLIALISGIVMLVKTIKSNKKTRTSNEELTNAISQLNGVKKTIDEVLVVVNETKKSQSEQLQDLQNLHEVCELTLYKINNMLEAESMVWSNVKDDDVRTNVQNVLNNARYKETSALVDAKEQLIELEKTITKKVNEVKEEVSKNVAHKKVTKTQNTKTNTATRV